jgi:hypothetical protein
VGINVSEEHTASIFESESLHPEGDGCNVCRNVRITSTYGEAKLRKPKSPIGHRLRKPKDNIVTCMMVRVTSNYGIRRIIGFISSSVTHAHLVTMKYKPYSAIYTVTIRRC